MDNISYSFMGRRSIQLRPEKLPGCASNFSLNVANDLYPATAEILSDNPSLRAEDRLIQDITDALRPRLSNDESSNFIDLKHGPGLFHNLCAIEILCQQIGAPIRAIIWDALDDRMPKDEPYEILIQANMSYDDILLSVIAFRHDEERAYEAFLKTVRRSPKTFAVKSDSPQH
jgi:hypothetical protein